MTGSPSTQKSYTYRLSGYGPAEEVWEVAQELALQDEAFAAKVSGKSVGGPASALPRDHVLEMVGQWKRAVLSRIAERTDVPLTGSS